MFDIIHHCGIEMCLFLFIWTREINEEMCIYWFSIKLEFILFFAMEVLKALSG